MEGEKTPGPKEIPEKFRDDGRLREAYLAGWSDCGAAVMAAKPEDDNVEVFDLGPARELLRRVVALEGQYRALKGDAADNARTIGEVRSQVATINKVLGGPLGGA